MEGPAWLRTRRAAAAARFADAPLPTAQEEIWRYTPIGDLDLSGYAPAPPRTTTTTAPGSFVEAIQDRSALVLVVDGRVVSVDLDPTISALGVTVAAAGDDPVALLTVPEPDALSALHDAFVPEIVVARVPDGVAVPGPIVVVSHVTAGGRTAAFPHFVVAAGAHSEVTVVDHWTSDEGPAVVSPVVEIHAGDGANVRYVGIQDYGRDTWSLGHLLARAGRDATIMAWVAAIGGDYARLYVDAHLDAQGGRAEIAGIYFGDEDQTHDFRSLQDHLATRSASNFVLKGAVVDRAHAVYTGLIRVHEGAKATESFLANRNLVLGDGAHVDSVPNLEIVNENDIRSCGHAAATGPVDEEHVFYLESRGVPADVAQRLIVFGFFDDVVSTIPTAAVREPLRRAVARKLEKADGRG